MKRILLLFIIISFEACLDKTNSDYQIIDGESIGKLELGKKIDKSRINTRISYKIDSDSIITELYTTSPEYHTQKGLRVGDNIQILESKYGKQEKEELEISQGGYKIGEIDNFIVRKGLIFYHENDTIRSIGVISKR